MLLKKRNKKKNKKIINHILNIQNYLIKKNKNYKNLNVYKHKLKIILL